LSHQYKFICLLLTIVLCTENVSAQSPQANIISSKQFNLELLKNNKNDSVKLFYKIHKGRKSIRYKDTMSIYYNDSNLMDSVIVVETRSGGFKTYKYYFDDKERIIKNIKSTIVSDSSWVDNIYEYFYTDFNREYYKMLVKNGQNEITSLIEFKFNDDNENFEKLVYVNDKLESTTYYKRDSSKNILVIKTSKSEMTKRINRDLGHKLMVEQTDGSGRKTSTFSWSDENCDFVEVKSEYYNRKTTTCNGEKRIEEKQYTVFGEKKLRKTISTKFIDESTKEVQVKYYNRSKLSPTSYTEKTIIERDNSGLTNWIIKRDDEIQEWMVVESM